MRFQSNGAFSLIHDTLFKKNQRSSLKKEDKNNSKARFLQPPQSRFPILKRIRFSGGLLNGGGGIASLPHAILCLIFSRYRAKWRREENLLSNVIYWCLSFCSRLFQFKTMKLNSPKFFTRG